MTDTYLSSFTVEQVEEAIGIPVAEWAHQCHKISIAMVKSDLFEDGEARVARGHTTTPSSIGIGQHSWVVVGSEVDDPDALIIDPTLWSYQDRKPYIRDAYMGDGEYFPKGYSEDEFTGFTLPPVKRYTDIIPLGADFSQLPGFMQMFYSQHIGSLDASGWITLFSQHQMNGWPSAPLIQAAYKNPRIRPFIPIDIVGNWTGINPDGLYLKGEENA